MFLELPSLFTRKLAIPGGAGICRGSPPVNLRDRVTLSPTVTVSRSRVAVKLAARSTEGKHPRQSASKAKAARSLGWLRSGAINPIRDNNLRMDTIRQCCPAGLRDASFTCASGLPAQTPPGDVLTNANMDNSARFSFGQDSMGRPAGKPGILAPGIRRQPGRLPRARPRGRASRCGLDLRPAAVEARS